MMFDFRRIIGRLILGAGGCLLLALFCAQPVHAQADWRAKAERTVREGLPKEAQCERSTIDTTFKCEFPVLRSPDPRTTKYFGSMSIVDQKSGLVKFGITKFCKSEDSDKCRSTSMSNDPELKKILKLYETIVSKMFALNDSACALLDDSIPQRAKDKKVENAAFEFHCISFLFEVKAGDNVIIEGSVVKKQ
jgi:hypothetical protein